MPDTFILDPNFSIIYHNPDLVEFRSGIWNVTSHVLEDNTHKELLAKFIHALEEISFLSANHLPNIPEISKSDCIEIFETLKKKKILVETKVTQIEGVLTRIPFDTATDFNKITIIALQKVSSLLQKLLIEKFPQLQISMLLESDISFILEDGKNLFSNSLQLEKEVTKFQTVFDNSFVIVVSEVINPLLLSFLNKVFYEANIPWFFAAIDGPFIYIGPLFTNLFCFECLENRILMTTKRQAEYIQFKKSILLNQIKLGKPIVPESLKYLLCSLLTIELEDYFRTGRSIASHKVLSIYLPTREFSYHKVLRVPGCKVCGSDNALDGHQLHFDIGALLES